jgi:hypothetical protein
MRLAEIFQRGAFFVLEASLLLREEGYKLCKKKFCFVIE